MLKQIIGYCITYLPISDYVSIAAMVFVLVELVIAHRGKIDMLDSWNDFMVFIPLGLILTVLTRLLLFGVLLTSMLHTGLYILDLAHIHDKIGDPTGEIVFMTLVFGIAIYGVLIMLFVKDMQAILSPSLLGVMIILYFLDMYIGIHHIF